MPYARLLNNKAERLTPSQKKLLNYILANDEEAIFLTIQELSQRVKVSVATVVRLAKALGYTGFPEFQQELRALFREKLTTVSRLQKAARRETGAETVLVKIFQQDIENITETMKQVAVDDFRRFVETLNTARRIVIIGLRSAHSLAVLMGVALEFLQRDVWIVTPGIGDMWDRLLGLRQDDVGATPRRRWRCCGSLTIKGSRRWPSPTAPFLRWRATPDASCLPAARWIPSLNPLPLRSASSMPS